MAYIDLVSDVMMSRHQLQADELQAIGEFTRENVLKWLNSRRDTNWVGLLPAEDFHAVCGAINIPWATEAARKAWGNAWGEDFNRCRAKLSLKDSKGSTYAESI